MEKLSGVLLVLIALVSSQLFPDVHAWGAEKVKLKDVQVLTLKQGQMTAGRRSSPVPQLNCVGGSARCEFLPRVVQCYNKGSDGHDVQWECKADLDNDVRFGDINVSCEGYDYPDDPYVLKGSCGLEYTIDFTKEGEQRYYSGQGHSHQEYGWKSNLYSKPAQKNQKFTNIACVAVVAIIVYAIYKTCISPSEQTRQRSTTNDDYDRRGPGSGSGSRPPPPGFRSDYYQGSGTDSFGDSCSSNRGANPSGSGFGFSRNAGGFWTGAAAGGLLGYMFGNRNNNTDYGSTYQRPRPSTSSGYSSSSYGFGSSPSFSSSSSGSRSSSGFGGTSRR